jgi:DNA-binding NtrC family response regulator
MCPLKTYNAAITLGAIKSEGKNEREVIQAELRFHEYHMTKTAQSFGLERSHLYKNASNWGLI